MPRAVYLAGREQLLTDLDARLSGDSGETGPRIVALCGLGGAGKTSVAVEYAYQHLGESSLVWQFQADDATSLTAGFDELARQLGGREVLDSRDPVTQVHGLLASRPDRWLLIFDNAPDATSLLRFLPPAGVGQVLITTQNPLWDRRIAIDVPVLGQDVAAAFLTTRTGDDDLDAARKLAVELGSLPLALEQAAAYMQAAGRTLAEYLSLFRDRRDELLARGEPAGYPRTVATTWSLAFGRIRQNAPQAAGLLQLLACCAPEAIPLRLLLQPRSGQSESLHSEIRPVIAALQEDPLAVDAAVTELRHYSLIGPPADGLVSMHRLVQVVTLSQLPPAERATWQQAAGSLIRAALPRDPQQPAAWPTYAALLPHARAALAARSDLMRLITGYLGHSGNFAAARILSEQLLGTREQVLGAEHPDTLHAGADLARWTGAAGDTARARDHYIALLPTLEKVLGAEHPDTLDARAELARWTGEAGDPAGSRDHYATLLPIRERISGAEHSDTLTARANLARWTGEAGNAAAARDQFAELLPIRQRVSGTEHPDTLGTRANLARWTGEAGNAAAARDQFAELLPIRQRVSGTEHPDTLGTRQQLAGWTGEAGNPAAARDQYADLLPAMEKVLGTEHHRTLTVRHNLASWIQDIGDSAGARDQYAQLTAIRERIMGAEHPDTLDARHQLAQCTGTAGNAAAARDQYAQLLPTRERVSGSEHPSTLIARVNLARWTGQAGSPADARDQLAELLPILERVSGPEHPSLTLNARLNLAKWTGEAGDPATARDQLAELLPIYERISGPTHPRTVATRSELHRWANPGFSRGSAPDRRASNGQCS